jgi:NAD(P)-dependent dehydrogenase (short-subunit alcohol dehydrogenase family)
MCIFSGPWRCPQGEIAIENVKAQYQGWTTANIPQQIGRQVVITGATGEIGYAIGLALARAGADIVLAAENEIEGRNALAIIRPAAPAALVRFERLDAGSLDSVANFAGRMARLARPIDLLVNAAGAGEAGLGAGAQVGPLAKRRVTADGFELHLGTSYLGHFALTAMLWPLLARSRQPRVVEISSLSHRRGRIDFDDLQSERDYDPWKAYRQSKLAQLIFALELQRRSDALGWGLISAAAHPGYWRGEDFGNGFSPRRLARRLRGSLGSLVNDSPESGALPALFASTAPDVRRGGFYGPSGPFELIGPPGEARIARAAMDAETACKLWEVAEQLTGVKWPER